MSDNLIYDFPYPCSDVFHVPSLIERLEEDYSIQLTHSLLLFQNRSHFMSNSLQDAHRLNLYSFTVLKLGENPHTFSLAYDEICTMEIRDYDPNNKKNCTVVLTGTEEQNERFLNILISQYPPSELMMKEPSN